MDQHTSTTPGSSSNNSRPVVVKKRSIWSTVAFTFLILLLITAGVAAWLWFMWQDGQSQNSAVRSDLSSANSTIADLREKLGVKNGQAAAEDNMPDNDEANIAAATKSYNASLANPLKDVKVEVVKRDGNQAVANVSDVTSGYKAYLKKANGQWVVVWSGQNEPDENVVKQFGLDI